MKNVKVILWGLGAMGGGIGKMLTKKKGVDIVGAIDIGDKIGKSLYDVVPQQTSLLFAQTPSQKTYLTSWYSLWKEA